MAFNIQAFLRVVDRETLSAFLRRHGDGKTVDWQRDETSRANIVIEALATHTWAIAALENCSLIAASGGRDLLRSAGHHRRDLMPGVDNIDFNNETCAVWLATEAPDVFDLIVSAAHALKGLNTRSWEAFRIMQRHAVHASTVDVTRMARFQTAVEHVLKQHNRQIPAFRTLTTSHFDYAVPRPGSHSRRQWSQFNIYAETAPETREVMIDGKVVTIQLPGLYRASIIFDPERHSIEVVAKGGRPVRDALVEAFRQTFLSDQVTVERLVRRQISFALFKSKPTFDILPEDPISDVVVDEIRLVPPSSETGLITLECRRQAQQVRDIYSATESWLGGGSPIASEGYQIVGVRLRLTFKADRVGKRARIVTVELKVPIGTTLRENTNADHADAERLFRRWGIFGPELEDE